jgi:ABC-type branched-subunit amino acid transport system ATPase component
MLDWKEVRKIEMTAKHLLSIDSVSKRFGGNQAVDCVSFDVPRGIILGLIGPNGSGKTTVLNMLSGELFPDEGCIYLEADPITRFSPSQLAHLGVIRMFQMTRVFSRLSAVDNLLITGQALGLNAKEANERANSLIKELTLEKVQYLDAGQLSGGQKKLLEFGMCFMCPPKIALLDEPFAAVHPVMRETMAKFITSRNQNGQTFLLVSHDMPIVKGLCHESICMNNGKIISRGPTKTVLEDSNVIEAYLGGDHE